MSDCEPTEAYVYQPGPDNLKPNPKIYGVGGSIEYLGKRFTKSEAQKIVDKLNAKESTK
jgi:hypothetical protein